MNVYLNISKQDKSKLFEIQNKYKISISTICDIVFYFTQMYKQKNKQEYWYKDKTCKIHIKPRKPKEWNEEQNPLPKKEQYNMAFSNVISAFCRKELVNKFNLTNEQNSKLTNAIYKEFQNRQDSNWNYNAAFRQQCRMFRQNKDYFKKCFGENK